ncbi:hypothetical protein [Luteolibacter luteus]|uniref:Uncharacterized protein n=1 Tax=Luteolibacter luteus TaxID=2728835 RepID=A0A858RRX4_9BACT|nr:hypothetical protein [Luteolibacter luteus]QJE98693.1 hypothetical protein HHL09_23890 [Luteolibacter luteus]
MLITLASVLPAPAHHGFDAHATLRLLESRSILIVRMTPTVAAVLLGAESPPRWTGDISDETRGKLEALGTRLFILSSPKGPLTPGEVRVSREVSQDIAFVLTYPAAKGWPLTIEADFCKDFGPDFTGSIKVFGQPVSAVERQGKQVAALDLSRRERKLSLSSPDTSP